MTIGIKGVFLIVAVILFILSAVMEPSSKLLSAGLAFFAGAF